MLRCSLAALSIVLFNGIAKTEQIDAANNKEESSLENSDDDPMPLYGQVVTDPWELLAAWFYQDWVEDYGDIDNAIEMYLDNTDLAGRVKLKNDLEAFLLQTSELSNKQLLEEWYKLGAEGWDPKVDLRMKLEELLQQLSG